MHVLDSMLFYLATPLCLRPATSIGGKAVADRPARILVIGDSHTILFFAGTRGFTGDVVLPLSENKEKHAVCGLSNYLVCLCPAATAYGLANNRSVTGAASKFSKCVKSAKDVDYVAIMIGEVDIRNLAYHRQQRKGVTMLEQIMESQVNLFRFIENEILSQGFKMTQVLLLGAAIRCPHVATTHDGGLMRLEVKTSHATMRFNLALRDTCTELGCRFANPMDDLLDFTHGMADRFFWSTPLDHHCSPMRIFFFWHRAIQRAAGLTWCRQT